TPSRRPSSSALAACRTVAITSSARSAPEPSNALSSVLPILPAPTTASRRAMGADRSSRPQRATKSATAAATASSRSTRRWPRPCVRCSSPGGGDALAVAPRDLVVVAVVHDEHRRLGRARRAGERRPPRHLPVDGEAALDAPHHAVERSLRRAELFAQTLDVVVHVRARREQREPRHVET